VQQCTKITSASKSRVSVNKARIKLQQKILQSFFLIKGLALKK